MPIRWKPARLQQWGRVWLNEWLPPYCLLCRDRCHTHPALCDPCLAAIKPNTDRNPMPHLLPLPGSGKPVSSALGVDRLYCGLEYSGTVRELVHRWKFNRTPTLTFLLTELAWAYSPPPSHYDCIAPVPMHWRRWLARGFNQSHLLALALQNRLGGHRTPTLPVRHALRVGVQGRAQHTLNRQQRLERATSGMRVCQEVVDMRILLIDDVVTTGATLTTAAQALKSAGAARVEAWCLAKTP